MRVFRRLLDWRSPHDVVPFGLSQFAVGFQESFFISHRFSPVRGLRSCHALIIACIRLIAIPGGSYYQNNLGDIGLDL